MSLVRYGISKKVWTISSPAIFAWRKFSLYPTNKMINNQLNGRMLAKMVCNVFCASDSTHRHMEMPAHVGYSLYLIARYLGNRIRMSCLPTTTKSTQQPIDKWISGTLLPRLVWLRCCFVLKRFRKIL